MLKIKFNINEFTIIFLRRFEGKNERKRIFFSIFSASALLSASALFSFVLCSALFLSFLLFQPSFLFLFSATILFSVQRCFFFFFFSTPFLVKHLPFVSFRASFSLSSCSPTFLKASPKLVVAQKAQNVLLQKPQRVAPFSSAPLFCSSPFSFQFFSLPTSKAIKKSSFGSIYPRPNILSSCFTSLLFE